MGSCKFCGESAGLLSTEHKQCRADRDKAGNSIIALLDSGFSSDVASSSIRQGVQEVAVTGRVDAEELKKLVLSSMVRWIDNALGDHVLSHEEEKRLTDLIKAFSLQVADLTEVGYTKKIVKGLILRDLSENQIRNRTDLSAGTIPISLGKGETIIFAFTDAEYHKVHTRTQYVGGSIGMSVRLMKGVYLRASGHKGEPIQTSDLQSAGQGIPMYFMLDDPVFAANLISMANSLN